MPDGRLQHHPRVLVCATDSAGRDALVSFLRRHRYAAYPHDRGVAVLTPEPALPWELARLERVLEKWSRLNAPHRVFLEPQPRSTEDVTVTRGRYADGAGASPAT